MAIAIGILVASSRRPSSIYSHPPEVDGHHLSRLIVFTALVAINQRAAMAIIRPVRQHYVGGSRSLDWR
jgi:hypothetical protein